MHNMGDWHWGIGIGHWFYPVLLWIAVFALVLIVIKMLVKDD